MAAAVPRPRSGGREGTGSFLDDVHGRGEAVSIEDRYIVMMLLEGFGKTMRQALSAEQREPSTRWR